VSQIVFLDGEFMPLEEAGVSVLDRGFLFGDGVYEVLPVYQGHPFRLDLHLQRLERSLRSIYLDNPMTDAQWRECMDGIVGRNGGGDLSIYIHVTRGVSDRRDHFFDGTERPTVFVMATPMGRPDRAGIKAVTMNDIRWQRCDIKAVTLLPNVLLRQQAREAGAQEAILLRDGQVTEGAASNVFVVRGGRITTPPLTVGILPGITRDVVLEIMADRKVDGGEETVTAADLRDADEVWVTSSTKEIVPVTTLDGRPVGGGVTGPQFGKMTGWFDEFKRTWVARAGQA